MKKIQLLYFPDCPNAEPARAALREALAAERVDVEVEEIDISREDTSDALKGWGSPTILVDGVDIGGGSPAAADAGAASCRIYRGGAPSVAQIRENIRESGGSNTSSSILPTMGAM